MDLSGILIDEIIASKSASIDGDGVTDERSIKERLDLEKEADPFWS